MENPINIFIAVVFSTILVVCFAYIVYITLVTIWEEYLERKVYNFVEKINKEIPFWTAFWIIVSFAVVSVFCLFVYRFN